MCDLECMCKRRWRIWAGGSAMVPSRSLVSEEAPDRDALTVAMAGIGMELAAPAASEPNIEDTLLFASAEAMDGSELRILALLVSWFGVHHEWVNADRLTKLVTARGSERVRALWAALAHWQVKDRRFARLAGCHRGAPLDLAPGAEFQIRRHGEDARFAGSPLRVPANLLRDRPGDIASPQALARRHRTYRWRIMMGPSYRADCWAALEADPGLSAAALARHAYASFATTWQVKRDFAILRRRHSTAVRVDAPTLRSVSRSRSPR
jgi:hypothetical protein